MNYEEAFDMMKDFIVKQRGRCLCPRCGVKETADYKDIAVIAAPARGYPPEIAIRVCHDCAAETNSGELEKWAIVHNPEQWQMVKSYFYTFGRKRHIEDMGKNDIEDPIKPGWVEIRAASWTEATSIFRNAYPERSYSGWDALPDFCERRGYKNYGTIGYPV